MAVLSPLSNHKLYFFLLYSDSSYSSPTTFLINNNSHDTSTQCAKVTSDCYQLNVPLHVIILNYKHTIKNVLYPSIVTFSNKRNISVHV